MKHKISVKIRALRENEGAGRGRGRGTRAARCSSPGSTLLNVAVGFTSQSCARITQSLGPSLSSHQMMPRLGRHRDRSRVGQGGSERRGGGWGRAGALEEQVRRGLSAQGHPRTQTHSRPRSPRPHCSCGKGKHGALPQGQCSTWLQLTTVTMPCCHHCSHCHGGQPGLQLHCT